MGTGILLGVRQVKIITFYTQSHRPLFERFCSTLRETNPSLELLSTKTPQRSKSGNFGTAGFNKTMRDKIGVILSKWESIGAADHFIFSDCDVQFLGEISTDLAGYDQSKDILFQDNIGCYCAGFMYCRKSEQLRTFFQKVQRLTPGHRMDDQGAINKLIAQGKSGLSVGLLPKEKYFTVAAANGGRTWDGKEFPVPNDVLVHHANCTVGIQRKLRMMRYVANSLEEHRLDKLNR